MIIASHPKKSWKGDQERILWQNKGVCVAPRSLAKEPTPVQGDNLKKKKAIYKSFQLFTKNTDREYVGGTKISCQGTDTSIKNLII